MPRRTRAPHPSPDDIVARRLALIGVGRPSDVPPPPPPPPDPPDPPDPPPVPVVPVVPVTGRHAARRRGPGLVDLVPEPLRGRFSLGPAQLAVVALLVAAAIATTGWWLVRAAPARVEAPSTPAATAGTAAALVDASPAASATTPAAGGIADGAGAVTRAPTSGATGGPTVTVDVAGKVRRPGIVVLPAGSRVVDALAAAGGARRGVDTSSLNLARPLVDGEQIAVGQPGAPAPPATGGGGGSSDGVLVNLNTASATELEELPEVGPVTAGSIVSWREEHGGFTAVDELLEVDGIGDATLAKIAPHVTV